MPKVTMIPATINPLTHLPSVAARKRRVAGYARVSTDSDEQFTSYEAQVDYYTKFIQSKPEWEFVKVYTDEGISGTNTKRREGFKEMIPSLRSFFMCFDIMWPLGYCNYSPRVSCLAFLLFAGLSWTAFHWGWATSATHLQYYEVSYH